jgi:hypothetical protein
MIRFYYPIPSIFQIFSLFLFEVKDFKIWRQRRDGKTSHDDEANKHFFLCFCKKKLEVGEVKTRGKCKQKANKVNASE